MVKDGQTLLQVEFMLYIKQHHTRVLISVCQGTDVRKIKIDDEEFFVEHMSDEIQSAISNIQYVTEQILEKHNQLQVIDTARIAYLNQFKREKMVKYE